MLGESDGFLTHCLPGIDPSSMTSAGGTCCRLLLTAFLLSGGPYTGLETTWALPVAKSVLKPQIDCCVSSNVSGRPLVGAFTG